MATMLQRPGRDEGRTASCWPMLDTVVEVARDARETVVGVRRGAKDAVEHLELTARRHPLAAVGVAGVAGFVAGVGLAFALGGFGARRIRAQIRALNRHRSRDDRSSAIAWK